MMRDPKVKNKMGHVTLTMPIGEWIVILMLTCDIANLCTKFDDASFTCSRYMIGARKV